MNIQNKLRKEIASAFDTKRLFGKELIKEDLLQFLETSDLAGFYAQEKMTKTVAIELVGEFKDFTTYLPDFMKTVKTCIPMRIKLRQLLIG